MAEKSLDPLPWGRGQGQALGCAGCTGTGCANVTKSNHSARAQLYLKLPRSPTETSMGGGTLKDARASCQACGSGRAGPLWVHLHLLPAPPPHPALTLLRSVLRPLPLPV